MSNFNEDSINVSDLIERIALAPQFSREIIYFEMTVSSPTNEELGELVEDILKLGSIEDLKTYYLEDRGWRQDKMLMETFYEFLVELVAED